MYTRVDTHTHATMHTYVHTHNIPHLTSHIQQQHKFQTGVALVCVLRLLWTLAVAELTVRTIEAWLLANAYFEATRSGDGSDASAQS